MASTRLLPSLLLLLLSAALLVRVEGLPTGPPAAACNDITPNMFAHSGLSQPAATNPYEVNFGDLGDTASGFFYIPGDTYTFTLSATDGTTQFRGFFIQARNMLTNELVGGFDATTIDTSTTQLSICDVPESGVTHNNGDDKTSVSVLWTAPSELTGAVEFRFSVVQVRVTFWANQDGAVATQAVVPPPEVSVVNDTPVVDAENGTVSVDFTIDSSRTVDAFCQLLRRNPGDNFATVLVNSSCFSGDPAQGTISFMFSDLSPAIYRVRIVVTDDLEQTGVRRKRIVIPDFDTDENICSVHLINSGVVVTGNDVTVSFREIGVTTGFMCRLDNEERETCDSPYTRTGLSGGAHRIKIKPLIPPELCLDLGRRRPLVVNFTV